MSLNYKVGLLIAALFFASFVASVGVDRLVIRPSFLELEQLEAERNTSRAVAAVHHELEVLSAVLSGWASRDEAYEFMTTRSAEFVDRSLSDEAIAGSGVSYVGFYRDGGEQLAHRVPGWETLAEGGLGRFQAATLRRRHPLLRHDTPRSDVSGLVSTPSGAMLVASRRVLPSSGEGPGAGVVIFGRLLDDTTVARIAAQYRLDLSIAAPTLARPPSEAEGPPADWHPGEPRRATTVRVDETGEFLTGETMIADMHGDPILMLRVRTPRAISRRGDQASSFALATLGGAGLSVLIVLIGLMHVTVLGPIGKLTAHAVELGRDQELRHRLDLARKDEIGVLASEFDRMTDRLAEMQQRLVDQSFVSGKADMAAGILHNLGNAVTPIAVRINTLRDRIKGMNIPGDETELAIQELEAGTAATERAADLARFVQLGSAELIEVVRGVESDLDSAGTQIEHVQQILTEQIRYSRAGAIGERVELAQVVESIAKGLAPEQQRAAEISLNADAEAQLPLFGPRVQIQQIVQNLILNAVESIQSRHFAGGRIDVDAQRIREAGRDCAHITFRDNGSGISAEDLARIFERRFSTKQRGSGLGLHWCANAVLALGGKLSAESAGPGAGAVFHLVLPLADTPSTPPESDGATEAPAPDVRRDGA